MTIEEFKKALLYAVKDSTTTEITSISEVDLFKICGIRLLDKNFIDFHKGNITKIDIDLDNEIITLGYQFLEKNSHSNKWFKRVKYQVIPIELIKKVLIMSDRTNYISNNIAFGLRLERNDPYYLSNPRSNNSSNQSTSNNNNNEDNEEEENDPTIEPPSTSSLVGYAIVGLAVVC